MAVDYGQKMRAYRAQNNISQALMAERMGLTQQNYSSIERGVTRMGLDFADNFKKVTGVDLIGGAQETPAIPKDDYSVLKFHYEQLLKFVMGQSERLKAVEEQLRLLSGSGF